MENRLHRYGLCEYRAAWRTHIRGSPVFWAATEGDIDSLRSEVLQGVVRFIALYDHEYDPGAVNLRQLKRTSPVTTHRSGQP